MGPDFLLLHMEENDLLCLSDESFVGEIGGVFEAFKRNSLCWFRRVRGDFDDDDGIENENDELVSDGFIVVIFGFDRKDSSDFGAEIDSEC